MRKTSHDVKIPEFAKGRKQFPELSGYNVDEIEFTAKRAEEWLVKYNVFAGQRPVIWNRLAALCAQAAGGSLRLLTPIHLFEAGKTKFLLDGQHILLVIAKMGLTMPLAVITYRHSANKWRKVAHRLFMTFDGPGGIRKLVDYGMACGLGESGLNKTQVSKLLSASRVISGGFTANGLRVSQTDAEFIVDMAKDHLVEMGQYLSKVHANTNGGLPRDMLLAAPYLSVCLTTFKYAPRLAARFWSAVATGDAGGSRDPRFHFREALVSILKRGPGYRPPFSPRQSASVASWSWNRFVDGKVTTELDFDAATAGKIGIARTPFDGNFKPLRMGVSKTVHGAILGMAKSRGVPDRALGGSMRMAGKRSQSVVRTNA